MTTSPPGGAHSRAARLVGWLGLALHLAVGVLPYAGSGLIAPSSGVAVLWALWALLLVAAVALLLRRPRLVPLVPAAAVGLWLLVVTIGDIQLGWTA